MHEHCPCHCPSGFALGLQPSGLTPQHNLSTLLVQLNRNLLDRHRALHVWENHHHVAISIRLVGHLWFL